MDSQTNSRATTPILSIAPTVRTTDKVTLPPPADSASGLPAWAQLAEDSRVQPWKQHASDESDDRDFAKGKDAVPFYDERLQVCYGEGSMAA